MYKTMTAIDFYDDTVSMNQTYAFSILENEHFITPFVLPQQMNMTSKEENNILHCGLTSNDKGFVKYLYNTDLNNSRARMDDLSSLYKAIELGKEENIRLLLDYGVRTDIKDIFGKTPLHLAASIGCQDKRKLLKIAKLLLDKAPDSKSLLNECTIAGETPLHCAVLHSKKELIKLFLQYGANVNAKNRDGKTALYYAIEQNNIDIITVLLKSQAKVNEKMIYGLTSLHEAVKQKSEKTVKLLLNYGAEVNVKDIQGNTPLHYAAQLNYLDEATMDKIVKLLLDNGADVNDHANTGETAFHCAIIDGNERLVRLFLDHGANVNSKDFEGKSSLHFAIKHSNKNIVKLLLDRGAEIGSKTNEGQMALHVAVIVEDENMVKTLLAHDADVNAIDESGRTPLSLAFEVAHMRSIYNPWNGFYPINSQAGCDDNIFELLIKHIAMLKRVCDENLKVMSSNDKLSLFYKRCQVELKKMKDERICDNICMYKVLTKDIDAVVGYARNENLSNVFASGLCAREFPIYNRLLRDRFNKADYRRQLLEPSSVRLSELARPFVLPELVVNKILAYLKVEDLLTLGMT